jgi:hypothetical protein
MLASTRHHDHPPRLSSLLTLPCISQRS